MSLSLFMGIIFILCNAASTNNILVVVVKYLLPINIYFKMFYNIDLLQSDSTVNNGLFI